MPAMRIGEIAAAAGVPSQTIRYYERRGLLPPPERGPNSYRDYDASALTRLDFIRRGQAARLTLVEIASVLTLRDEGSAPCSHVQALLATKLSEVQARQSELASLEVELAGLLAFSERLDPADCADGQICTILAVPTSG